MKLLLPNLMPARAWMMLVSVFLSCCFTAHGQSTRDRIYDKLNTFKKVPSDKKDPSDTSMHIFKSALHSGETKMTAHSFTMSASGLSSSPLTVGLVRTSLEGIVEGIGKQVREQANLISADLRAQLEGVMAQANFIIGDIDRRFSRKLEYTFKELNKAERRFFEDAEALMNQLQYTLYLAETGAYDLVKKSALEADILAYSAIGNFKSTKNARFVFIDPFEYRVKDGESNILFKVRGNYLNLKNYDITIDGEKIKPVSKNDTELVFQIPERKYLELQTDQFIPVMARPVSRKRVLLFFKKHFAAPEQSVALLVKPQLKYNISVEVIPIVKVPTLRQHNISAYFHTNGSCDANYAVDRNYGLPPDYEFAEALDFKQVHTTTANCGSRFMPSESRQTSENTVFMRGQLTGCGKRCVNLLIGKICDCKGNGWLGYSFNFMIKKYDNQIMPAFTRELTTTNQQAFVFEYPAADIPADNRGIDWMYTIRVTTIDGPRTKVVEISETNPNVGFITSRMDTNKLILQLPVSVILAQ